MSLVDQLTILNQRLSALPSRFGVPQYVTVVMERPDGSQVLIEPNPKVTGIDQNRIGKFLSDSVQIQGDELVISGISRLYPEEDVRLSRYLINPELTTVVTQEPVRDEQGNILFDAEGNQITEPVYTLAYAGGQRCKAESLDTSKITTWTAIVVPRYTK